MTKNYTLLNLIEQYPIQIKYGLFLIVLFVMIVAIKTYINYLNIETSIENMHQQSAQIRSQKLYEEKFRIPYEQSERAYFFLQHENNILNNNEYIVILEENRPEQQVQNQTGADAIDTPQEARKHFLQSRIQNQ